MLSNDTKLFNPNYFENEHDMQKEFAKQCHKHNDALPISSIVIQDWFSDDLYALMNHTITPEQSLALANTFKYMK